MSNPLGVGIGAFPKVRNERFGRSQDTHNLYLEVATNIGIHGFFVFFGLLSYMYVILIRIYKNIEYQLYYLYDLNSSDAIKYHIQDLRFMKAIVIAISLFIGVRLALGMFGMDLYEIYWWFALGTSVAIYNINNQAKEITNMLSLESQQ